MRCDGRPGPRGGIVEAVHVRERHRSNGCSLACDGTLSHCTSTTPPASGARELERCTPALRPTRSIDGVEGGDRSALALAAVYRPHHVLQADGIRAGTPANLSGHMSGARLKSTYSTRSDTPCSNEPCLRYRSAYVHGNTPTRRAAVS